MIGAITRFTNRKTCLNLWTPFQRFS